MRSPGPSTFVNPRREGKQQEGSKGQGEGQLGKDTLKGAFGATGSCEAVERVVERVIHRQTTFGGTRDRARVKMRDHGSYTIP